MEQQRLFPPDRLASVMSAVKKDFDRFDHSPSSAMMLALADIPITAFGILEDRLEPKLYLSPIDCGVGKTTTLKHTIRELRRQGTVLTGNSLDFGVVICVGRLSQIEGLVKGMELEPREFAVLTSDQQVNKLSRMSVNDAPVLLTTHSMIESRLRNERLWRDAKEFYYKDQPRKLRVWDESVFIRDGISIDWQSFYGAVSVLPTNMASRLRAFVREFEDGSEGDVLTVPDLASEMELSAAIAGLRENQKLAYRDLLTDLWFLSDKPVRVRQVGSQNATITYRTHLPEDIYPLLVLDASARTGIRETYQMQNAAKRDVVWLKPSHKQYSDVCIYQKEMPAGKQSYHGKKFDQKIADIVSIIKRHAQEKILILHHKPGNGVGDIEQAIRSRLDGPVGLHAGLREKYDVRFCHWGVHNSTNDFSDCSVVICASIFTLPDAMLDARARAVKDHSIQEPLESQERVKMRQGEIRHDLLQGLSRGSMRKLRGDQAQTCTIYLPYYRNSGVKGSLQRMFPGCTVYDGWQHEPKKLQAPTVVKVGRKLTKKQQELMGFILSRFDAGAVEVPFPEMQVVLNWPASRVSERMNDDRVKSELRDVGLVIDGHSRPRRVLRVSGG